jgi:hypothetical protein
MSDRCLVAIRGYGRTLYTTSCSRACSTTLSPKSSFGPTSVTGAFEGLPLAEIGGVSADVDYIANAQPTGIEPQGRD